MAASATVEEVSVQVPKRPEATTNEAANTPNFGSLIPPTDLMSVSVLSWPLVRSARAHTEGTCISSGDERRPPPLPECQPVQSACQIGSIPHGPLAAIRAAESTL